MVFFMIYMYIDESWCFQNNNLISYSGGTKVLNRRTVYVVTQICCGSLHVYY